MKRIYQILTTTILFCFLNNIYADAPTEQLKQSIDEVLSVLKDPKLKMDGKEEERKQKVTKILEERFNFREMSKRALGREWNKLGSPDRNDFVEVFKKLLETTYLEKIEQHANENVVFGKKRSLGPGKTVIETAVVTSNKEIPIHYNLMEKKGKWEVYDVKIEGVGLIKNYRTQFRQTLQKRSFIELLKQLKEKLKDSG